MRNSAWMMLTLMICVIVNVAVHPDQMSSWAVAIAYFVWYIQVTLTANDEAD